MDAFYRLKPRNGFVPKAHAVRPMGMYRLVQVPVKPVLFLSKHGSSTKWCMSNEPKSWMLRAWESCEDIPLKDGSGFCSAHDEKLGNVIRIILRYQIRFMVRQKVTKVVYRYPNIEANSFVDFVNIESLKHLELVLNNIISEVNSANMTNTINSRILRYPKEHINEQLLAIIVYRDHTYDTLVGSPDIFFNHFNIHNADNGVHIERRSSDNDR